MTTIGNRMMAQLCTPFSSPPHRAPWPGASLSDEAPSRAWPRSERVGGSERRRPLLASEATPRYTPPPRYPDPLPRRGKSRVPAGAAVTSLHAVVLGRPPSLQLLRAHPAPWAAQGWAWPRFAIRVTASPRGQGWPRNAATVFPANPECLPWEQVQVLVGVSR